MPSAAMETVLQFVADLPLGSAMQADAGHLLIRRDGMVMRSGNCLGPAVDAPGDPTVMLVAAGSDQAPERTGYRALVDAATQLANALLHLGIRRGDGIALHLAPGAIAATAALACRLLGAVAVPADPALAAPVLAAVLHAGGCRVAVTSDARAAEGTRWVKERLDTALLLPAARSVETVIVARTSGHPIAMRPPRDRWYHILVDGQRARLEVPLGGTAPARVS